jgi:hypothetical protein
MSGRPNKKKNFQPDGVYMRKRKRDSQRGPRPQWQGPLRPYGPMRNPDPLPRTDLDARQVVSNQPQLSRTVTELSQGAIPRGRYFGLRSAEFGSAFNYLDLTSKRYINAVVNPFGTDQFGIDHIDRNSGVRVPTLSQCPTYTMTFYRKGVFTTHLVDSTHAVFCITKPTTDKGICIDAIWDNTAVAAPTNYTRLLDGSSDAVWFAGTLAKYYRIVSCGIKVNPLSALDVTTGHLAGTAGDDTPPCSTVTSGAPSAYNGWSGISDSNQPQSFSAAQGCTARYDPTASTAVTTNSLNREAFSTVANYTTTSYNDMPRVELAGSHASTFLVEVVCYLEIIPTDRSNCPLSLGYSPSSNDWHSVGRILSNKELNPTVSHGHSFKDFMAGLWGGIKKFGKGVYDFVSDPNKMGQVTNFAKGIGQVGSMILPLL